MALCNLAGLGVTPHHLSLHALQTVARADFTRRAALLVAVVVILGLARTSLTQHDVRHLYQDSVAAAIAVSLTASRESAAIALTGSTGNWQHTGHADKRISNSWCKHLRRQKYCKHGAYLHRHVMHVMVIALT